MKQSAWLMVVAGLVLAGCEDLFGRSHRYGTVSLLTSSAGGAPLADVTLRVHRGHYLLGEGITDVNGSLELRFIPRGPMELRAFAPPGWVLAPDSVTEFPNWIVEGERVHVEMVFVRVDAPASP
jgi:hypothetical protein